ncbi:MAG TPA: hypothetical protein VHX86_18040 [Tepidisphaeraceae bacterium]|jgi:hypothetical protein|nr:hypothetical protein [Tepidisphaeraceae bacterium]
MVFRTLLILTLVFGIAAVLHQQFTDRAAAFSPPAGPTPDAAAALRSLSGVARPSKPWIDDFAGFSASHPGRWIVGRCARPCLSQPEAEQSARSDAARAVYAIARDQIGPGGGDEQWLARRVLADVRSGALANDALAERFDRPYGTVWAETVLLDASPARLDGLVDGYRSELRTRRARIRAVEFGAGVLTISAWIAYLLLDMMSRGYFTWRLRLIAGTITVAALLVLLGGP